MPSSTPWTRTPTGRPCSNTSRLSGRWTRPGWRGRMRRMSRLEELEMVLEATRQEVAEVREKERRGCLRISGANKLAAVLNQAVVELLSPEERKLLAGT